ncbi:hypothetical protein Droror1_Dr00022179 [Drosera rotundifolia]
MSPTPPRAGARAIFGLFLISAEITSSSFPVVSPRTSLSFTFSSSLVALMFLMAADCASAPMPPAGASLLPMALVSAAWIAAASLCSTLLSPALQRAGRIPGLLLW